MVAFLDFGLEKIYLLDRSRSDRFFLIFKLILVIILFLFLFSLLFPFKLLLINLFLQLRHLQREFTLDLIQLSLFPLFFLTGHHNLTILPHQQRQHLNCAIQCPLVVELREYCCFFRFIVHLCLLLYESLSSGFVF